MMAHDQKRGLILFLTLCLIASDGLFAQQNSGLEGTLDDRRHWNRPLFLPNSDIPSAAVRRLGFESGQTDEPFEFYSAGEDKVVRTWSVSQAGGTFRIQPLEKLRWPLMKNDPAGLINAFCRRDFSDNLQLLAFGGFGLPASQEIRVINLAEQNQLQSLVAPKSANYQVFSLDFHPTLPLLAACLNNGKDSQVAVWKIGTPSVLLTSADIAMKLAHRLRFSPNGNQIVIADQARQVRVWDFDPDQISQMTFSKPVSDLMVGAPIREIAWVNNQTWVAASYGQGLVRGDVQSKKLIDGPNLIRLRNSTLDNLEYKAAPDEQFAIAPAKVIDAGAESILGESDLLFQLMKGLGFKNPREKKLEILKGSSHEIRKLETGLYQFVNLSWTTSMGTSPDGRLIAMGAYDLNQERTFGHKPGTVTIKSFLDKSPPNLEQPDFDGIVSAVAVSDDKKYVLAAGTNRSASNEISGIEIRLWSAESGKLLATFPSREQLKTSSGSIAQLEHDRLPDGRNLVRFSRGPYSRFMDRLPAIPTATVPPKLSHAFQLTSPNGLVTDAKQPRSKLHWTIGEQENANKNHVIWRYTDADVAKSPGLRGVFGPFSAASQASPVHPYLAEFGVHLCAKQFLTKSGDHFLAVGYERAILIWDVKQVQLGGALNSPSFGPAICRGFVGHDGNTTCLAVDDPQNAKLLISGSDDGTICGWSLDGLQAGAVGRNELGVTFELQEQGSKLVVKQVNEAKPGYTAGFSPGQEVVLLDIPIRRSTTPPQEVPQTPAGWKSVLEYGIPGVRLVVDVKAGKNLNKTFKLQSNLLQQPLWTLYPWNDGQNWVIWSPEGYFAAPDGSAQTIGKSIGWQINSPLRFNSAEAYWELYQSNLLFNDLLMSHNKQRFLAKVHGFAPPINVFPSRIFVQRPPANQGTEPLRFEVKVETAGEETVSQIQFWCNGRLREFQAADELAQLQQPAGLVIEVGQNELRSDGNLITAIVESKFQDQILLNQRTLDGIKRSANPPIPKPPQLHYLGIGVTKLDHEPDWKARDLVPLKFAANDVVGLAQAIKEVTGDGRQFATGRFQLLLDPASLQLGFEQVSKELPLPSPPVKQHMLTALRQLTEIDPPAPDDLLVIHLAGHGLKAQVGESDEDFFFVTQNADAEFGNALSWTELEGHLNKLSCKTLLLMDTCYAGAILSPTKAQQNRILGAQIMTSSSDAQVSRESEFAGRVSGGVCGHGLFTAAVIEALTGHQLTAGDGETAKWVKLNHAQLDTQNVDLKLSVEELGGYVKRRVPELLKVKVLKYATDMFQVPQVQTSRSFATESTYLRPLDSK